GPSEMPRTVELPPNESFENSRHVLSDSLSVERGPCALTTHQRAASFKRMSQQKLTTVGLVLVAAVVGGAAGAGATWAMSETTGGAAKKQNTRAKQVFDESSGELALRLARLENELVALKRRNSSTESLRQYARVL